MENISAKRLIVRAEVHLVEDDPLRRELNQRIEMFVNDQLILGAPTWDLSKDYPYISIYASLDDYNIKVNITSEGKQFSTTVVGLDQSVIARVSLLSAEKTTLQVVTKEEDSLFPTFTVLEQKKSRFLEEKIDLN